ncbi:hypothetical protein P691DRAFT_350392 [Macrolepiota fuliginosa MF-IS2]|uniref:Uncharacterized protein n=1 Tax=Macrolepiota fuliginosa MF-IS2 TaxID=1400762 RepID=A0A9P6C0E5_9AGAR|nr:hypothetical protein P691DRAFT_350392 [Macrolepiota fuliginosa MF-IS2]
MIFDFKSPLQRGRDLPPEPDSATPTRRARPRSQYWTKTRDRVSRIFDREAPPDPALEGLENEVKRLEEVGRDIRRTTQELEDDIQKTKQRLTVREERRKQEELKRITNELAIAQRFLSTADSMSQAEVIRAMEALNEEIFQLTSIVADMVQVERQEFQPEERHRRFRERVSWLGPPFLDIVMAKKLDDALAIQIGWQACLSVWCCTIIQAWVAEDPESGLSKGFRDIYGGIISTHGQAIAGRWRSIGREVANNTLDTQTRQRLLEPLISALAALPVLLGYIFEKKAFDNISNAFSQRMGPLLDKCLMFRKMVGEGVTSVDIEPYVIASGEVYDSRQAELEYEDEKEGAAVEKEGVVACSLGLGLYSARWSEQGPDGKYVQAT